MRPWIYKEYTKTTKQGAFRHPAIMHVFACHLKEVSRHEDWYELCLSQAWPKNALLLACLSVYRALVQYKNSETKKETRKNAFSEENWGLKSKYARLITQIRYFIGLLELKHWELIMEDGEAMRQKYYPRAAKQAPRRTATTEAQAQDEVISETQMMILD